MAFNDAAVRALVDSVTSHAEKLGIFRSVNTHEPKSAPGNGLRAAVWADSIEPVGAASGLNSSSGYVILNFRIYGNMLSKPEDEIDPRLLTAASTLMTEYTGDFDFDGSIRAIDLLGIYGQKLTARAGYLTIANHMYRVMTLTVPCIIDNMFTQAG